MIKKCLICGAEFESKASQARFCGKDCKNANQRQVYHARKQGLLPPSEFRGKKHKKANQDLVEIARRARAMGLSYGQYIARMKGGQR